jgi:hypothetical protein
LTLVQQIIDHHGLVQALTHPDPGYLGNRNNRDRYQAFLAAIRELEDVWRPLPREVAAWWRSRDASPVDARATGTVRIARSLDDDFAVAFEPPSGARATAA